MQEDADPNDLLTFATDSTTSVLSLCISGGFVMAHS